MVNLELEKQNILKKHKEVYGGGNRIYIGSTDRVPKKVTAQTIVDNPDVLRKSKNPFPFEGEILDAPDMPDIVKELTDITLKKEKKVGKLADKKVATKKVKEEISKKKWTKEELSAMNFSKLKEVAIRLGETGRSVKGLIKDILKHN